MANGKKGQSPTGRTNNRLHDDDQFAVMRWFDKNRDRVHEKMTYPEIVEAVAAETGVAVTKGNIEGAMKDFGLRVRPLPTASPLTRAGAERVRTDPGRIVLTSLERYNLRSWADDNRDRIHRKMTYEEMTSEVQQRIGLKVGRGNLRSVLKPLGLVAKKNFQDSPVGLTGTPDGEPVPGEPTTRRSGAYKRAAQGKLHDHDLLVIQSQMSEVMQRLRDLEGAIVGPGK